MRENDTERSAVADDDAPRHPVAGSERAGYLGFVAHEMRNPLSTALWSAELLGRLSVEDRGGARGEKLSGMCLRTLTRLRILLEDYFLVERLGVHGLPVKREPVGLAGVVEHACGRLNGEFEVPPLPDVTVSADRSLLDRMMESVIAIASRDSTVKIDVAVHGGTVEVRITGAPPAADALETPAKGTPSDSTGRALALLVARSVAAAHGGELRVDGDAYIIALPLTDLQPSSQP